MTTITRAIYDAAAIKTVKEHFDCMDECGASSFDHVLTIVEILEEFKGNLFGEAQKQADKELEGMF